MNKYKHTTYSVIVNKSHRAWDRSEAGQEGHQGQREQAGNGRDQDGP